MATAATASPEPVPADRERAEPDPAAERAREAIERYGDEAATYVETRIEAARTSGEPDDVLMWERTSRLLPAAGPES